MNSEKPSPGTPGRLGPYRLDQPLGSGGMGKVWRAWDERLERWVALKQVRVDKTVRHGRERLRREARAVARLNHPAIVHVYDLLEGEEGDWIVMELIEGRTLRRLLDDEDVLSPVRTVELGRQIVEGLAEAHARGILHRDLKATNVIVTPFDRAKILDFGLAKAIPRAAADSDDIQEQTLSTPGLILGTYFAMSPEQALGRELDPRSDLFSFGSLLYEMLTGEPPFLDETAALSLARVVQCELPPLQKSRPELPAALCNLVDWLLQKEPSHRPQSTAVVLKALQGAGASGRGTPPLFDEPTAVTLHGEPHRPVARLTRNDVRPSSGERRTVTIVCCTLVQLDRPSGESGGLDLEVLSAAAIAFESLGQEICGELDGSLGAVLSRMLWLCFGYPRAHENDAERAVRAARELQARFAALPLASLHRLAVRAGVHTGPAVVNRTASGEALQPGHTFDIALALQGRMPGGRIAVSAASRQLLLRRFATQPLPPLHLQELDLTVAVYELGSPLETASREGGLLPPLVNRTAELQLLLDRFRLASVGAGQAVLIVGEAGIGKSHLVETLLEQIAAEMAEMAEVAEIAEAPVRLTVHGSAFAQNTPLAPILHLLSRAIFAHTAGSAGAEGSESAESAGEEKLRQLEAFLAEHALPVAEHGPLLGALLSLPIEERYPPLVLSPEARRKRTLAAVLAVFGAMSERQPLVLVIEDLHWIDPSTLDVLDLLLRELPGLPLLLVATFRPELTLPWNHRTAVTQLSLSGLTAPHAEELIERVTGGRPLAPEMHREIVARTDGVPLFVEELTKAVLEADVSPRQPEGIPFTLVGSLLARLDRLGEAKEVAQLAAVLGRTFSLELLAALSRIQGAALSHLLGRLVQAEILYRRGPAQAARYMFKHALIQDAAYLSLLASDRRELHRRLALLLQEDFPAVAEAEPERMAHHCERGGLTVEAVDYLLEAGLRATQRSAQVEAMRHLSRALDLLGDLPSRPELLGRELSLRSVLTVVLEAVKGWGAPEVAGNAERCVALCRELGEHGGLLQALSSLWAHHLLRADRQPAIDLAAEIARLAETPAEVFMGFATRAYTAYYGGRFIEALALSEQATKLYEPDLLPALSVYGDDAILMPHLMKSWVPWVLGEAEKAVRQQDAALAIAESLGSPFALGLALVSQMTLWRDLRVADPERVFAVAERLLALAGEQEFAFLHASAQCGQGWALCQRGDLASGTALIETGLDRYAATGARLMRGYWSSYRIEAHLAAGHLTEGLAVTREARALSETQLDICFDAEIHRLEGELLRASGDARAAEASFLQALGIAREQGALLFELRTATSLSRLLVGEGRGGEALPALAATYQAFHEGFETPDLREARELLDRLGSLPES